MIPNGRDRTRSSPRARVGVTFGCVLVVGLVASGFSVRAAAGEEPAARLFAAHALALREAGVTGKSLAADVFADMPGVVEALDTDESLDVLWRPFFENAVVKLGRLRSPAPVALYYNPLLDIAVFTSWEKQAGGYRVASARALPGERLADPDATAVLQPLWTVAKEDPIAMLRRIAAWRLDIFRRSHPAEVSGAGRDATAFATAAADMQAVLPRLVWNMAMRVQWAEDHSGWLEPALGRIDAVLATREAAAIKAAAPDTDVATAGALASLPAAFAEGLALDMMLEAGSGHRLMIASSRGDGHIYLLAVCRLDDGVCSLRRLLLTSLEE